MTIPPDPQLLASWHTAAELARTYEAGSASPPPVAALAIIEGHLSGIHLSHPRAVESAAQLARLATSQAEMLHRLAILARHLGYEPPPGMSIWDHLESVPPPA